jgi:hypothetical protein
VSNTRTRVIFQWNRVLLGKLIIRKFSALYISGKYSIVHKRARRCILSSDRRFQPTVTLCFIKINCNILICMPRGRGIAQAVSRRHSTATARVRSQIESCGICGGKKWHWGKFSPSTSASSESSHSTSYSTLINRHIIDAVNMIVVK